jgi:hypothetical protein
MVVVGKIAMQSNMMEGESCCCGYAASTNQTNVTFDEK